ncbi:long-chain fatty acid--CoA ligase [Corynebacterium yudongzhengii]|uniref:Long-chain fatty acid--CoA ligase n=1 Tax=Corynebacterium yudongzhengii TaxID=2080740 RepID=A0A2U1T9K0_9CORY|nr:long-chain fatty-acid--CoA ligase [Corynebacterium yudongzhengii]AWB82111.1 long-chain fatty acid--CoA ligase [Corynebacterium yudongzhengii]PWC02615.1 long-chain fatty acid--CoA ligase [Corynebacterium yudongzhengii]
MLSTMQDIPLSITRILEYGASVHGSTKVTTWTGHGPEETTFHDIAARSAAFAHALQDEFEITGDERVGTLLDNCAEHLEVMFAACCMDAVFTPLNRQLMADQIEHIINHSEMEIIVSDPEYLDLLEEVLAKAPKVRAVALIGQGPMPTEVSGRRVYSYEALLDGRSTRFAWPTQSEQAAAAVCYSTGTTGGAPKGVVYSHRSTYLQAMTLRTTDSLAVTHGDSFLCGVPIYHVLSWGVPFAAFMSGTPLVFPGRFVTPEDLAEIVAATHPRVAHGVPSIWTQLMVHYLHHPPERMSLTEIYVGGSPASTALMKIWEERYGVDIIHVWGMTETSTVGTVARPPSGASVEARQFYRSSQGRFLPALEYRVVNDGEVVATTDRNHGEIQVRGNLVTGSYLEGPPGMYFRGEPVTDGSESFTDDGWLRTGDVGTVTADGFLQVSDRARDIIRSGGEWIYSAQLENIIMEAEAVIECAVIGIPSEKWGERPLAVTVLHEGYPPTEETAEEIRQSVRKQLPNWMVPEYWTFVDHIDKTSVDKFDKKDLREHRDAGRFDIIRLLGPGERRTRRGGREQVE